MIAIILKFFITVFAILASLLWLSNFIADLVNPQVKLDDSGTITTTPRGSRFWAALIAAALWAALIAFF